MVIGVVMVVVVVVMWAVGGGDNITCRNSAVVVASASLALGAVRAIHHPSREMAALSVLGCEALFAQPVHWPFGPFRAFKSKISK